MRQRVMTAGYVCLTIVVATFGCGAARKSPAPIFDSFTGPDLLLASERQPGSADVPWLLTSGSLFRSDGTGWSGIPDDGRGDNATGSTVFRMVSREENFSDVEIRLKLKIDELVTTARTPSKDYDGVHVWVRYKSDQELYALSVDRRDGAMIIKKKCRGGTENGGTYFDLAHASMRVPIPVSTWQEISVKVRDRRDGLVDIVAARDGHVISAVDTGVGCTPLRGYGRVGIRGDNAELHIDDLQVIPTSDR